MLHVKNICSSSFLWKMGLLPIFSVMLAGYQAKWTKLDCHFFYLLKYTYFLLVQTKAAEGFCCVIYLRFYKCMTYHVIIFVRDSGDVVG